MILIPRKYNIRPNGHLEIDWSNEHTASLIAVFPMNRLGSMGNLVTGEDPLYLAGSFTDKTTTEGTFAGFNTSADYVTYDPLSNHGIVDSTPVTIAWQQSLDTNSVYLMSPFSWMPSGLTRSFAITTAATGAGGNVQYGMTIGTENGTTTTNAGFGQIIAGRTVGVHEKFVVVCTEGMHTTNAKNSHWLYRNGIKIAQPTVGYNLANATTVGLKVGNTVQAPSWPMIGTFGEICIWKRAKSQEEITDYNNNPYQIYRATSNRVYFDFSVASAIVNSSSSNRIRSAALSNAEKIAVSQAQLKTRSYQSTQSVIVDHNVIVTQSLTIAAKTRMGISYEKSVISGFQLKSAAYQLSTSIKVAPGVVITQASTSAGKLRWTSTDYKSVVAHSQSLARIKMVSHAVNGDYVFNDVTIARYTVVAQERNLTIVAQERNYTCTA